MNQQILFVMRNMDDPELFTQEEKHNNKAEAWFELRWDHEAINRTCSSTYAAKSCPNAFVAAQASQTIISPIYDAGVTNYWLDDYFKSSGEDRQLYTSEVKRLKEPWHTLAGETPDKDKRMEMTQDNFYRVLAMNDELIHQQKDEIAKLKQTVNKLRMKEESNNG